VSGGNACKPFTLLASTCADMLSMGGCASYKALCRTNGSVVAQCTQFPALER
jgi:hypothetical protein